MSDVVLGGEVGMLSGLRLDVRFSTDRERIARAAATRCQSLFPGATIEVVLSGSAAPKGAIVARVDGGRDARVVVSALEQPAFPIPRPRGSLSAALLGSEGPCGRLTVHGVGNQERERRLLDLVADVLSARLVELSRPRDDDAPQPRHVRRAELVDPLTGLGNRRMLQEDGPVRLAQAQSAGRGSALLMLDLDNFKQINDTLGHHSGDIVLREVARRIRTALRDTDLACRLGGDEFAVLTSGLASSDDVALVAGNLLSALGPPVEVEDVELQVDASVGVAVLGPDGTSLEALLRQADRAMYDAKASGASQWRRTSAPSLVAGSGDKVTVAEIARATNAEQLVLHYQPQIGAESGRVVGYEVLARWQHPRLGLLSPADFLPLAERAGLMRTVDSAVLDRALADHAALSRSQPALTVSVNVSPRSLLGQGLVEEIGNRLAVYGVPAARMTLEITEPTSQYSRSTRSALTALEELGCSVSIHEFGSGQASLAVLSSFRAIKEIKLAPALVASAASSATAERMVRAIVHMAHAVDVRVVAEGIETSGSARQLRDLGCDVLQGSLVKEPVPRPELEEWLRRQAENPRPLGLGGLEAV